MIRRGAGSVLGAVLLVVLVAPALPAMATPALERLERPEVLGPPEPPPGWAAPPEVTADAYVLVAAPTGQVLAARAPETPSLVASTVKILTAISVLRRLDPDATVAAGPEVAGLPPLSATVGLVPGERWALEDLLEGLVARSGNDAARALAVAVGGSIDGFVAHMRSDAAALGLEGLELHTPTGLEDRNRMSASHLALLTRVALRDPLFRAVASRATVSLPDIGAVESRNALLATYPGAYGVKTGFTSAAGRCLVAAARRDGRDLVVVVLGSDGPSDHFEDARRLLDFGFTRFAALAPGPVRLRVPGGWLALEPPAVDVFAPTEGGPLTWQADVPVHASGGGRLRASWDGARFAQIDLSPAHENVAPETIGQWLAGRSYAAMRAATADGMWPGGAPDAAQDGAVGREG